MIITRILSQEIIKTKRVLEGKFPNQYSPGLKVMGSESSVSKHCGSVSFKFHSSQLKPLITVTKSL